MQSSGQIESLILWKYEYEFTENEILEPKNGGLLNLVLLQIYTSWPADHIKNGAQGT